MVKDNKISRWDHKEKIMACIDSCTNWDQLYSCKNMIENFRKKFSYNPSACTKDICCLIGYLMKAFIDTKTGNKINKRKRDFKKVIKDLVEVKEIMDSNKKSDELCFTTLINIKKKHYDHLLSNYSQLEKIDEGIRAIKGIIKAKIIWEEINLDFTLWK